MFQFPPIPSWDGLHPLIIHFPIVLLLIAPLLVIVGAVVPPEKGRPYHLIGLALMALGTIAVFVSVGSGEAAGELAERTPEINQILEKHENLAEQTRAVFSVLTIIYAALLFVPRWIKSVQGRLVSSILPLAFLIFYSAGALLLVNTAHNGGRLVHEFGVRAIMPASPGAAAPTAVTPEQHEGDKD